MQHLIIHLPYQARLGGPVAARWMYTYERCIGKLKPKVRNKARVEGSIVEAYLVEEATNFLSLYFKPNARSVRNKVPRYDDSASTFEPKCNLDIFKFPGRCMSPQGTRELTIEEYKAAFLYILTNIPEMDHFFQQFKYVDPHSKHYKYTMQLGIILKREHPGVIEEKEGDVVIRTRPALEWSDYYDDDTLNDMGQTAADRVKQEFWNLFEIHVKDDEENPEDVEEEADRVLDNYASKKVRDMMYQLRVDAVKFYYEKQGEHLDDTLACSKELEYNQYMEARIPWFKEHAWPTLCTYWCSKGFLTKRRRGQDCRLKSQDVAQNRGGSRPFVETRQYLAEKYGTDKATILNTYAAMKSGLKNWDGSGSICSTMPRKAKKRLDDYSALARAAHPDDWEQQELDGRILYESSGGIPHGRVAIADGAIRKVDIISAARERKLKLATSVAHRQTVRENEELKRQNANLQQTVGMHQQLILTLYKELGKELPSDVLRQLTSSQPYGTTNSSQAGDDNTRNGGSGVNNGSDDSGGNIGASNPGTN